MPRWKAAALHLLISLAVAICAGSLIFFVWYPRPYFTAAGGNTLTLLIIAVDVVIGPLLTFSVFKSGKKGLRFDLTVISLLQLAAFCYGMYVIAAARPVFIVAAIDRFILVAANSLDDADLAAATRPEFRTRSWFGPRLVGAVPPQFGKEAIDMAISGTRGKDVELFPKYYVPYAQVSGELLEHSRALSDLAPKSARETRLLQQFRSAHEHDPTEYRSIPLKGRTDAYVMIVTAKTAQPVTTLAIDPWGT